MAEPDPRPGRARGRHPEKRLTQPAINAAKPGRHADGGGLYLEVDDNGAKRWVLRTVVHGRRRDLGLGGLSYVTLAEAREKARKLRAEARDPIALRDKDTRARDRARLPQHLPRLGRGSDELSP